MVIGVVEPIGGHGGMDYYDYGLCFGLGLNDVTVLLYTSNDTNVRYYQNVSTHLYFNNMWKANMLLKIWKFIFGHIRSYIDIKRRKGNLVHLHFFTFRKIDLLVLLIAKILSLKVIGTIHDIVSFHKTANPLVETLCLKLLDSKIVHNLTSFDVLMPKLRDRKNVHIIPHGNYAPFISRVPMNGIKNKEFTLLFFGQIKKVKGLDILLRAIGLVKEKGYSIKLLVSGKVWKSDLGEYQTLIEKLNIRNEVVTNFNYIPDEEVSKLYLNADLVVLPYREIYQSGVLLLSMSYGRPVLCSNLNAFKEIVTDGFNGFLFNNLDYINLSDKIIYIIKNQSSLKHITQNAFTLMSEKYSWEKIGRSTKSVYKEMFDKLS